MRVIVFYQPTMSVSAVTGTMFDSSSETRNLNMVKREHETEAETRTVRLFPELFTCIYTDILSLTPSCGAKWYQLGDPG